MPAVSPPISAEGGADGVSGCPGPGLCRHGLQECEDPASGGAEEPVGGVGVSLLLETPLHFQWVFLRAALSDRAISVRLSVPSKLMNYSTITQHIINFVINMQLPLKLKHCL